MPQRETFFQPTAVIRTNTITGERVMEIDFGSSMIKDNDHYLIDTEGSDFDGVWLDEILLTPHVLFPSGADGVVEVRRPDPPKDVAQ